MYVFLKEKTLLLHQLFKSSLLFCVVSLFSIVLVFFLDLIVPAAASCSCQKTSCSFLSLSEATLPYLFSRIRSFDP